MALTMRPTGLGSGLDKDRQDYTVYVGEWAIGRIYEVRGGPESLRWFWSFSQHGPMMRSGRDLGRGEGGVPEKLERLEGVGEAGGGALNLILGQLG